MIDYVPNGVQSFLDGIVHFVVDGSEKFCHLLCLREVRSPLETHREAVQSRPPGLGAAVVFHAVLGEAGGDCAGNRRV